MKLNSEIRNFVEYQIRCWPENKKILHDLQEDLMPKVTANYDKTGKASGIHRPTEAAAIRLVTTEYIYQLDFAVRAIESVYTRLSDEDKELIRLQYWNRNLTPDGIALRLNMSKATLFRRLKVILYEIASRLGYINRGD